MIVQKNSTRVATSIILAAVALLAAACMGPTSPTAPVYYYALDYPLPESPMAVQLPYVLRVARFTATPPFNTQRIIYADKGLHRNAYASSQWIASPGEMLAYNLTRDLLQSGGFQAVLTPDAALMPTHIVNGWVENFIEEGLTPAAQAAVRLNITLIDAMRSDPGERILFQKTYSAKAPLADKTADGLAVAMSEAAARLSSEIVHDIYNALTLVESAQ